MRNSRPLTPLSQGTAFALPLHTRTSRPFTPLSWELHSQQLCNFNFYYVQIPSLDHTVNEMRWAWLAGIGLSTDESCWRGCHGGEHHSCKLMGEAPLRRKVYG